MTEDQRPRLTVVSGLASCSPAQRGSEPLGNEAGGAGGDTGDDWEGGPMPPASGEPGGGVGAEGQHGPGDTDVGGPAVQGHGDQSWREQCGTAHLYPVQGQCSPHAQTTAELDGIEEEDVFGHGGSMDAAVEAPSVEGVRRGGRDLQAGENDATTLEMAITTAATDMDELMQPAAKRSRRTVANESTGAFSSSAPPAARIMARGEVVTQHLTLTAPQEVGADQIAGCGTEGARDWHDDEEAEEEDGRLRGSRQPPRRLHPRPEHPRKVPRLHRLDGQRGPGGPDGHHPRQHPRDEDSREEDLPTVGAADRHGPIVPTSPLGGPRGASAQGREHDPIGNGSSSSNDVSRDCRSKHHDSGGWSLSHALPAPRPRRGLAGGERHQSGASREDVYHAGGAAPAAAAAAAAAATAAAAALHRCCDDAGHDHSLGTSGADIAAADTGDARPPEDIGPIVAAASTQEPEHICLLQRGRRPNSGGTSGVKRRKTDGGPAAIATANISREGKRGRAEELQIESSPADRLGALRRRVAAKAVGPEARGQAEVGMRLTEDHMPGYDQRPAACPKNQYSTAAATGGSLSPVPGPRRGGASIRGLRDEPGPECGEQPIVRGDATACTHRDLSTQRIELRTGRAIRGQDELLGCGSSTSRAQLIRSLRASAGHASSTAPAGASARAVGPPDEPAAPQPAPCPAAAALPPAGSHRASSPLAQTSRRSERELLLNKLRASGN